MTPVEFYTARLDELEALARAAQQPPYPWEPDNVPRWRAEYVPGIQWVVWRGGGGGGSLTGGHEADARHAAANDPACILADIAAKRAILRLAELQFQPHAVMDGMGWEQYESGLTAAYRAVVSHLIQPFATHPDFDESWKL